MSFDYQLKQLREKFKLTQKEFGEKIGISAPTVVAYEQGKKKPSYETLILIANTFNVSLDWLCEINIADKTKVETWSDITKPLYAILSNEHIPSIVSFGKDENDIERCFISFARHLVDSDYYPAEVSCPQNQYIEIGEKPIDGDYADLFYLENPIYKFAINYSRMKKVLDDKLIDKEIFDSWLSKQFEEYDYKIWNRYNTDTVDFLEDSTNANNNEA